jgi:hypothetical protein
MMAGEPHPCNYAGVRAIRGAITALEADSVRLARG